VASDANYMILIDSSCETSVEKCSNFHVKTKDKSSAHLFVKEPLNLLSVVKKAPGFCNVHKSVTLCGVSQTCARPWTTSEKQFVLVICALQCAIIGLFQ
jgi:hypothetical protein